MSASTPDEIRRQDAIRASLRRYWRTNVRIMLVLLGLWALAGLGCGVLFAGALNSVRLGGFPLGFWFAQQGAIIVFVVLILVYAVLLNRLDARHHAEVEALQNERGERG
jgi:putative solute:sodium symporter small subunit